MSIQRRTRLSAAALALGLGVFVLLGPLAPAASAATPATALDSTFATLLNTLRTTLGLGSLSVDPQLASVAQTWSVKMASSGTLSHNGSLTSQVSGWAKVGENVGTGGAVTQIFNALVASPSHMRNMSDRDYTRVGVGTVSDGDGRLWTTHVFMRPKSGDAAAAPAPAPLATVAPEPAPAPAAAPKPVPTTAAPTTAPPATAAPTTVPVPTTAAPAPVQTAVVGQPTAAEPPAAPADHLLASNTAGPGPGVPAPVLAGAALLALLVLGGGGFLLRHSSSGRDGTPSARFG